MQMQIFAQTWANTVIKAVQLSAKWQEGTATPSHFTQLPSVAANPQGQ